MQYQSCPECGLVCKSLKGLSRHRHSSHGVETIMMKRDKLREETKIEKAEPAPAPVCNDHLVKFTEPKRIRFKAYAYTEKGERVISEFTWSGVIELERLD